MRRLVLVLLAFGLSRSGEAAPIGWADPAGLCNGETPCFTSLAAAVANAGPAPATVFLFPGTYAESVDLSLMGSALGSGPGDLSLVSVDAAGQPAPGAIVDSGAPGGPGAGRAIEAVSFPASLTLDGLVLRSPDTHALLLGFAGGDLTLRHLTASGNPGGNGILAIEDPAATITIEASDLLAEDNGADGVILAASRVLATRVTVRNNAEEGLRLGDREVVGRELVAEGNGQTGVFVGPAGPGAATFELEELTLRGNETGLRVFPDPSAAPVTGSLHTVAAAGNTDLGILVFGDQLVASDLVATQNGDGIILVAEDRIEASGLGAIGNLGMGISAVASEVRLLDSTAENNGTGISLGGDLVVLESSTATASGPSGSDPFAGAGFVVAANRLEATDNRATANQVGWIFDENDPLDRLLPVSAAGRLGRSHRGGPVTPQQLTLRRTVTEDNLSSAVEARLRPEGNLSFACSDFRGNGQPGFDLQAPHVVTAHRNFWGDASGPTHPRNPGGTGDPIQDGDNGGAGTVLFGGFLAQEATEADCPLVSPLEVPALGSVGLVLLAGLLVGLGLRRL